MIRKLLLCLIPFLFSGCYFLQRPDMRVYEPYFYQPPLELAGPGKIKMTYMGTSSLYFDDGETRVLIDGFFTRPDNLFQIFFGEIETNKARVAEYLKRLKIERLDAIPVFHSHYDHAMDSAEIARLTGAKVLGSESTAMVMAGSGLPAAQIQIVEPGKAYQFGKFRITMTESKHVPLPGIIESTGMMGDVSQPLKQPASIYAFAEGMTYAILIEHPLGNSMLHSGSFLPGELKQMKAKVDTLFLCSPGLPKLSPALQEQFYQEIIVEPGVKRVVPVHWDDFSFTLDQPLVPLPRFAEDLDAAMDFLIAKSKQGKGFQIQFMPEWKELTLYQEKSRLFDLPIQSSARSENFFDLY